MNEEQYKALVEKLGKEAAERIKADIASAIAEKGFLTAADVKALIPTDAKGIKIGDTDLDTLMRGLATDTQEVKELVKNIKLGKSEDSNRMAVAMKLEEKMADVERIFKSKQGVATITLKDAAVMTISNTIDETTTPDDIIESFSMGEFVPKRYPRQWIFDIADRVIQQELTQYKTWLEEGDEEGAFAVVAEGAIKPLVSYDLVRNNAETRKIAGKYIVTEEFTKFRKEAYRIIQRLIQDKLQRDYAAILSADLIAAAAAYVSSALDGQYTNPTDYHAIAAVAAQIEGLNFMPDTLILNPQDKWRIGMSQDSFGQFYTNVPMYNPNGEVTMLGMRVVASNYITAGNFILGEGRLWKIDEEPITIRMGYGITVTGSSPVTQVVSDFDNNQFRVIVETFFRDYIATNHEGSFVYANFDAVKEALQASPE